MINIYKHKKLYSYLLAQLQFLIQLNRCWPLQSSQIFWTPLLVHSVWFEQFVASSVDLFFSTDILAYTTVQWTVFICVRIPHKVQRVITHTSSRVRVRAERTRIRLFVCVCIPSIRCSVLRNLGTWYCNRTDRVE